MKFLDAPAVSMGGPDKNEDDLEYIRRHVRMDHVLAGYGHLADDMMFVHPSWLGSDFESYQTVPERFLIVLPSPFGKADDENSVVVFLENNLWEDLADLRPHCIQNDIIGFVMAYDRCTYYEAIEKLLELAHQIQWEDQDELESQCAGLREDMERLAEHQVTLDEASKVREQIFRRFAN